MNKWLKFGFIATALIISCLDYDVPEVLIFAIFAGLGVYAVMLRAQ